jgi:hypothetical protein
MDLAYFNIYQQDDEVFVPWIRSEENPEKCIYKMEVKTKKDLENAILNAKWSTIDIPLINFNHFEVLDNIYFEKNNEDKLTPSISNNSMIQKIREGIRNGTIVKEVKPDGTYVWKKVRK